MNGKPQAVVLGSNTLVLAKEGLLADKDRLEIWANAGYRFDLEASAEDTMRDLPDDLNGGFEGLDVQYHR